MQRPVFSAQLDDARATVHARGRLDPLTADLLHGTLQTLQRRGHRHITVDVRELHATRTADHYLLASMVKDLAASGTRLTLRHDCASPTDNGTSLDLAPLPCGG